MRHIGVIECCLGGIPCNFSHSFRALVANTSIFLIAVAEVGLTARSK